LAGLAGRTTILHPNSTAHKPLPGWTWWLPFLILHAGTWLSINFRVSPEIAVMYLPVPLGIALVQWWGPRVILSVYVNAIISAGMWGFSKWYLWPVYGLPETLIILLSWVLFRRLAQGRCWLPQLRSLLYFALLGMVLPVTLGSTILFSMMYAFENFAARELLPAMWIGWSSQLLAGLVFSVPLMVFLTPVMERHGWSLTSGARAVRMIPPQRSTERTLLEVIAVLAALLIFSLVLTVDRNWFLFGLLAIYCAVRFGIGAALIANLWIVVLTLLLPLAVNGRFSSELLAGQQLVDTYISLGVLCFAALVVGRTTSDNLEEMEQRQQVERRLSHSQKRYEDLFFFSNDAIFIHDMQGNILDVNPKAGELLNCLSEDLLGKNVKDFCTGDEGPQASQKALEELKEHNVTRFEITLQRDGSDSVEVDVSARLIEEEDGRQGLIQSVVRDITGKKRNERKLRQSEALYRGVYDVAPMAFVIWGRDCRVTDWNRGAEEIFGWRREEVLGRSFFEFLIPEEDRPRVQDVVALLLEGNLPGQVINKNLTRDGQVVTCEWNNAVLRSGEGEITGAISLGIDITARIQAEEDLRRSEKQLARAAELARVGHWEWWPDSGELIWTDETYRAFGYEPGSFKPRFEYFMERVAEEDRDKVKQALHKTLKEGEPCNIEFHVNRADGTSGYLHALGEVTYGDGGQAMVMTGSVQDVTERHKAEEERLALEAQVQQSQKMESLGLLAGGIAHDFNNLLVGILGNADLALDEVDPAGEAHRSMWGIITAARRAAELCRQMLAYSGKGRFIVQPVNLNHLVEEMAQLLVSSISKKARLKYNFCSDLPCIEADSTQIRQVVMNLIVNASEALEEREGTIEISTGVVDCSREELDGMYLGETLDDGNYVYLCVKDNGCGMDESTLNRIFDPFFSTKFTGRGLGLAAALGIVRGHQGAIRIDSRPGQGTRVEMFFPVSSHEEVPSEFTVDQIPQMTPHDKTVLVVDDEGSVRWVAEKMLRRAGLKVLLARDGREAVQVFKHYQDEIDCVVLDLTMPVQSGDEVFRQLKLIRSDVPVLLSSGYTEKDIRERYSDLEAADFLQKPYSHAELIGKVLRVLEIAPAPEE
jgi:PAS domain S-box-containing protein